MSNALTQTTLSAAVGINGQVLSVASATGIAAPVANFFQLLYVIGPGQMRGELMQVVSVSGTQITVNRLSEFRAAYPSGSLVVIGFQAQNSALAAGPYLYGSGFYEFNPPGTPHSNTTSAATAAAGFGTPWINAVTGEQWIYSSVVAAWVPGWGNPVPPSTTAAVASAASAVTPSGPLFHVTGTAAITGFTRPVGCAFGKFTVIPDGNFTWTTGDGTIGLSGTAVTAKALDFVLDPAANSGAGVWYPSYA